MSEHLPALRTQALLPAPSELRTMLEMADTLVKGRLLPDKITTAQAAFTVMQKGIELGVPPMAALNGISVINGKPTCSAELMAALIYRDHGDNALDIAETTNERCTIHYKRRSWPQARSYTFTREDAQKAQLLGNQSWNKYPAAMLRARCISAIARFAFPDSIGGLYTHEEMGADVDEAGEIVNVRVAPAPTMPESAPDLADEAPAVEASFSEVPADPLMSPVQLRALADDAKAHEVRWDSVLAHARQVFEKAEGPLDLTLDQGRDLARWIRQQARQTPRSEARTAAAAPETPQATEADLEALGDFEEGER